MNTLRTAKSLLRTNLKRLGVEIRRAEPDLMDFVRDRGIDIVLDVGANIGQFGGLLRVKGYRGRIVSFEPIHAVYEELAAKAAADGNWEASNFALGANADHGVINVSRSSVYSSILPSTHAAAQFDDQAVVSRTERIEVRKLDDIDFAVSDNIFLKIDTQGFEREVLEGGKNLLPRVKGVLMELPIVHLYERTWQFHEAVEYMADAGFVPAQIHPVNYHTADQVSLVEVDCLFRPRDSRFD